MAQQRKTTIRTTVALPQSIYTRVQALAEANDVSASWVMRQAIVRFIEEHEGEMQLPLHLPKMTGD